MADLYPPYDQTAILQYLQGKMTGAEQHAIELAALNDPLLYDAIEGYRLAMTHQDEAGIFQQIEAVVSVKRAESASLAPIDLNRRRPKQMFYYAAAACLVLAAGWWIYNLQQPQKALPTIAQPSANLVDSTQIALVQPDQSPITAPVAANKTVAPTQKPATAIPEALPESSKPIPTQPSAQPAAAVPVETAKATPPVDNAVNADLTKQITATATAPSQPGKDDLAKKERRSVAQANANNNLVITGKVINQEKYPLDGVQLTVRETGKAIVTDALGRFNLEVADTQVTVIASAVGFDTKTVKLSSNNASNEIALESSLNRLDEVVVIGYGADKNTALPTKRKAPTMEVDTADAAPVGGWLAFEKHLYGSKQRQRQMAKKAELSVILSFEINAKGRPENFYVIRSGGAEADKKAIQLVETGPNWRAKAELPVFAKVTVLF